MTNRPTQREGHPYHMYDAILAQPAAIERVLQAEVEAVGRLAEYLAGMEAVHLVGIGTSWHAATVGAHLLRTVGAQQSARAWNAQEFCLAPPPLGPGIAVLVLSHGGTRRYTTQALGIARSARVFTAVITGRESAFGADSADVVLHTSERDPSAAFTVSHTTALTALLMLAVTLGERSDAKLAAEVRPTLAQLSVLTEWAIAAEMRVHVLATDAHKSRLTLFVGTGPNVGTAYEAALKVNEASQLPAFGYQAEQLLHGPFVVLDPSDMVVAVVAPGPGRVRVLEVVEAARAAGARTVVLADEADRAALAVADDGVPLPAVPEPLSPIVYLGPLQLLAYWLAVERGVNPDLFRRDDPGYGQVWERFAL